MPTADQIIMLFRQRGPLCLTEIGNYFQLNGAWVAPVLATLNGLVAAGTVYTDPILPWYYMLAFGGS
jgi:hypothetical protein